MIPEQSGKDKNFINVSILLTVALCIGIYLIVTTALIAKDGVTFIKYAMQLEIAPVKTMIMEYQHPGYPWLILTAHKMTAFLCENTSLLSWIYCGQSITLIFRLLAVTVLYFIGKHLFGARMSFWGVLILIVLPRPAEYGSDALSDWPHLFFLAAGLFLLLQGATSKRWRLFGFAGLFAGVGYLIRPECSLLVVSGGLWLGLQLLRPKPTMSQGKAVSALVLLLMGFLAIAVPYMILKGALFPKKNVGQFVQSSQPQEVHAQSNPIVPQARLISQFTPWNISKALGKLAGNISGTLMWFFVPALLIGMCTWFKTRTWHEPDSFFIVTLIVLNIPIMIWLYCKYGYMSDRHTLPLLLFPILYVPVGLQQSAIWLRERFSAQAGFFAATNRDERFWFLVLAATGVLICAPKLLRPIRSEKQGCRAAANWLKANTDSAARIAVPDKRISFYAERTELVYEDEHIPEKAEYIVKIFQKQKDQFTFTKLSGKVEYEYVDKTKRGTNVVIYRNF
jgi:hypothetical protein